MLLGMVVEGGGDREAEEEESIKNNQKHLEERKHLTIKGKHWKTD